MAGVNANLALGAILEVSGLAGSRIYSMAQGHQCPRCLETENVKSRPEDMMLEKKELSRSDTTDYSHGLYILTEDDHKVPEVHFPFFEENMQPKTMQFYRSGNRYYLRGVGWKEFAHEKVLHSGDAVKFFALRCRSCEGIRGRMIKAYKKYNALTFDVHG